MALQICPNCKHESFLWTYDDESTPHTTWHCGHCHYDAREDEAQERICIDCGTKTETQLRDDEKQYWWCSQCNRITPVV